VLAQLELSRALTEAGAEPARTVLFSWHGESSGVRSLPEEAVCISRFALDLVMAEAFSKSGGTLKLRSTCRKQALPGLVHACGRSSRPVEKGWRWFGLKVHMREVPLAAHLEMHAREDGYVGLSRLHGGIVNVCGLFRRRANGSGPVPPWFEVLRGPPGTRLHKILSKGTLVEGSFCAVAGLPLRPAPALPTGEFRIGDALTMIPPITGNGMSMALEAAALATEPLVGYSRGQLSWREAQVQFAADANRQFAQRLAWADWLQKVLLAPHIPAPIAGSLLRCGLIWRFVFQKTR
jgi:menaquinone-9 beta-reductase